MIESKPDDVLVENAEVLVDIVDSVGVMGCDVVLQFKKAFPETSKSYAAACKQNGAQPGRMFVSETGRLTNPRYIIDFPTKLH